VDRAQCNVDRLADDTSRITAAMARGDSAAFGLFYDRWFDHAYGEAQRFTQRDEATCLDIVQETMLKAARSMRMMDSDEDLARWLTRVVQTSALDTLRQEQRRRTREIGSTANTSDRPHEPSVSGETQIADRIEWLKGELGQIPASDQALLRLRFALGRTLEQTGKAVGISGDAAHGKIRRIIAALRGRAEDMQ
jgi:RNA polymerase sigma factor (sigma-70 family)